MYAFAGDGGAGELALMVLDHYAYTGDAAKLQRYLPIATLLVDFFDAFYQNRTADGTRVFWPVQALETWWCPWPFTATGCCVNDMPSVSAMASILPKLLLLPQNFTTPTQRAKWSAFLATLPPLPHSANGTILLGAEFLAGGMHNSETPELYAVHPHRVYTVGTATTGGVSLSAAIASYNADPLAHANSGWNQGVMNAALLGLADDAYTAVAQRANTSPAPGYRFPAFAPHEQVRRMGGG